MKVKIFYNDFNKNIDFDNNITIGKFTDKLLHLCSLLIYNIEYIEILFIDNTSYIFGSEEAPYKMILKNFLESIEYEECDIYKIIIYDRKRDNNGNVIKNNIYIDNYVKWFEKNQIDEYNINYVNNISSVNNTNNINNNLRYPIEFFIESIFRNPLSNLQINNQVGQTGQTNEVQINETQINEHQTNEPQTNEPQTNNINIEIQSNQLLTEIENNFNDLFNTNTYMPIYSQYTFNGIPVNRNNSNISTGTSTDILNGLTGLSGLTGLTGLNGEIGVTGERNNLINEIENNFNDLLRDPNNILNRTNNFNNRIENMINSFDNYIRNLNGEEEESDFQELLPNYNIRITHYEYPLNLTTPNNLRDVKIVLNYEKFEQLEKINFDKNNENLNKDCLICLDAYENNDEIIKIPCNHMFHKKCIKSWLCEESNKCPICRIEVDKGIIKDY